MSRFENQVWIKIKELYEEWFIKNSFSQCGIQTYHKKMFSYPVTSWNMTTLIGPYCNTRWITQNYTVACSYTHNGNSNSDYMRSLLYPPPLQRSWKGGHTGITLSVRPSVRLWIESCPLRIFNNTYQIHFIFAHLIKQLQKVCCVLCLLKKFEILAIFF